MAIATISKRFTFAAAHDLPNHDGKCRGLHGHNYAVVIEVEGAIKNEAGAPDEGMVLDFGRVRDRWKEIEPLLDHRYLNDSIGPQLLGPTTAENIALWILDRCDFATAVTVWETESSSARVDRVGPPGVLAKPASITTIGMSGLRPQQFPPPEGEDPSSIETPHLATSGRL